LPLSSNCSTTEKKERKKEERKRTHTSLASSEIGISVGYLFDLT
jgi:hypothetical protein